MIYASKDNNKIRAYPKGRAACPFCDSEVIAKCGEINIWHWAHIVGARCDEWGEESDWHLAWKALFPPECVEVTIKRNGIRHRADVLTPQGLVVELQHSPISPSEIAEREAFYGNMIWIFDVKDCAERFIWLHKSTSNWKYASSDWDYSPASGNHWTFGWKHCKRSLAYVRKPIYLDFGEQPQGFWFTKVRHLGWNRSFGERLFQIKGLRTGRAAGGWGYFRSMEECIELLVGEGAGGRGQAA